MRNDLPNKVNRPDLTSWFRQFVVTPKRLTCYVCRSFGHVAVLRIFVASESKQGLASRFQEWLFRFAGFLDVFSTQYRANGGLGSWFKQSL